MNRSELIKLLMALQNEAYKKSGINIDRYPFICFDFCSDYELNQHYFNMAGN